MSEPKKLSEEELNRIRYALDNTGYSPEEIFLIDHIDAQAKENKVLEADMAALIQAGNEMRKNLSIWTGHIESACYRWDEVVNQTTAIGAVLLLREAEEARTLRTQVQTLEAHLTFATFPDGQTYDEWVAGGAHNDPANSELWKKGSST